MRKITNVNLVITDECNRVCPDCCCSCPDIANNWNLLWGPFLKSLPLLSNVSSVNLTGGEPTCNTLFYHFAYRLRELGKRVTIETNGFKFGSDPDRIEEFDTVFVSKYGESNADDVDVITMYADSKGIRDRVIVTDMVHRPRVPGKGRPCVRATDLTVSVYKYRVYPCCMGWGVKGQESVPFEEGWMEKVAEIVGADRLGCANCLFSE